MRLSFAASFFFSSWLRRSSASCDSQDARPCSICISSVLRDRRSFSASVSLGSRSVMRPKACKAGAVSAIWLLGEDLPGNEPGGADDCILDSEQLRGRRTFVDLQHND